jgi:hypothetical protein
MQPEGSLEPGICLEIVRKCMKTVVEESTYAGIILLIYYIN